MSKTTIREQALAKSEEILAEELVRQVEGFVKDLRKGELAKDDGDPEPDGDEAPADPGTDQDAPADPAADPATDSALDADSLVAAYAQMSPEELQQHADAIAQAQAQAGGGSDPGAGPDMPPVEQAEKSEAPAWAKQLQARVEELAKRQAPTPAPPRRAATGPRRPANVPAPTSLSKAEVRGRLLQKARDPGTTSRDRQLINSYVTGTVKVDAVQHLLK